MSVFYGLLKEKAEDASLNDMPSMIGRWHGEKLTTNYVGGTYSQILAEVNYYIEVFKTLEAYTKPLKNRRKYIAVDNSLNSIAAIIALLECEAIPVIIDAKNIKGFPEDKLPFIFHGDMIFETLTAEKMLDDYLATIDSYEKPLAHEDEEGGKLIICSSGSEGFSPHFNLVKESNLLNLPQQYGDNGDVFFSYISCANISGILTNIVNFLVHNNTILLAQEFDLELIYFASDIGLFGEKNFKRKYLDKHYLCSTANPELMKLAFFGEASVDGIYFDETSVDTHELLIKVARPNYQFLSFDRDTYQYLASDKKIRPQSMMFPRNILNYLSTADLEGVDLSSLKHIYLAGGINSMKLVNKVRNLIPTIPAGVFTNLYGSTEANGVMCTCDEKDFRTCYINIGEIDSGVVTYTYDKLDFFEIKDGKVEKIDCKFDGSKFFPYLTVSSKKEEKITVDEELNIKYKGDNTGDLGIYIDDRLYVLGRRKEKIKLNNRTYLISALEAYYSELIDAQVYISQVDENAIQPYIKVKSGEFPSTLRKYRDCLELSNTITDFKVNPPIVLDEYIFPESKISGKISKSVLHNYDYACPSQLLAVTTLPDSIVETSKFFAELVLANYSPIVHEDGSFTINIESRMTLPITEIFTNFFKAIKVTDSEITFAPKDDVIFMTSAHTEINNYIALRDYKQIGSFILDKALDDRDNGLLDESKYVPLNQCKTAEELWEQLRFNIEYDILKRAEAKYGADRLREIIKGQSIKKGDK